MAQPITFTDRTAVLATMHHKEKVIAPLMAEGLGVRVVVPPKLDTDSFGTFTRDIPRQGTQLEAAKAKAEQALRLTGETMAIASEGMFFPHPGFPYIACNRELVLLIDQQYDLEIAGYAVSTTTNYSHDVVSDVDAALAFASKVGFPEHGLIVMPEGAIADSSRIIKGIVTEDHLLEATRETLAKFGKAHLETDMRAMYNPTRMAVIQQATQDLIKKLQQRCPQCEWPGFDVADRRKGLPCAWCSSPTELTLAITYLCKRCSLNQEQFFPNGQKNADPEHCSYCNP